MAIYKQRGSKIYWYEFQFDGVRYRASSKSSSSIVARDALRAHRRRVEEGFNEIKRRKTPKTFSSALDEFLKAKERKVAPGTFDMMKRSGARLRHVFGKAMLIEMDAAEIMDYKERGVSDGLARRTVNMDIELIRAVLRRNGFWERVRPDVSMYRLDDEFGYELPESDEPRLLDECARSISRGLYTAITLALSTGMRSGEIKHLLWSQVFLDNDCYLIVGVSKTNAGRRRRVPLNTRALAALSEWSRQFPNRLPNQYVFPAEKYSKEPDGKLAAVYAQDLLRPMGSWRGAWKAACRRAGIQMRFHDLRHTAITRMLRAGVPLTTVASIVGWSPSTMYLMAKRYAHILQPEMRKAVAVLDANAPEVLPITAPPRNVIPTPERLRPRYDREELYDKVWQIPMRTLAKDYGVCDVALARTCRKLKVPVPGRGYWSKKAAGLPVPLRPPLPPQSN